MKKFVFLLAASIMASPALGQVRCNAGLEPIDRKAEARLTPMDFVRSVAANEVAFSKAFAGFGYTLDVSVQTLEGDVVDGEYRQVSKLTFDDAGARRITELQPTTDTLSRMKLQARDIGALRDGFTITPDVLADRDVVYSGRQRVDNFNLAAFDILPRNDLASDRGFNGRVWVRQRDSAIARTCGRVPDGGAFGPMRFVVDRIKVADKFWFPALIRSDDKVPIGGKDVHVRIVVKYADYTPKP